MKIAVLLALAALCVTAAAQDWQPVEDHPNPAWARQWLNLNGEWRFDFDPENAGLDQKWFDQHAYSKTIRVPYPWQSRLSGIGVTDYNGAAWYERDVTLPTAASDQRVFLVFGAVDWEAQVWVNGQPAAQHEGGYTPFEVELTPFAKPGATARVTVRAYDVTDPETPSGKQTGWYTQTGGIWQTVYLETRGGSFLSNAHITSDIDSGNAHFRCTVEAAEAGDYAVSVDVSGPGQPLTARKQQRLEPGENVVELTLDVPEPALWSPDSPSLYTANVALQRAGKDIDTAQTYFGMRKVSRGRYAGSEFEYILLNDKPIYLRGALHQSFNPEGIYTHPDDDYIRRDYELAKKFGLNFIRIHIKVEEPRALYWADKLGVLLMCDMPNFTDYTEASKQRWLDTFEAAVARDYNHPSVFSWCLFNETWGFTGGDRTYTREEQEWVHSMYLLAKNLDPTRLIEDNSPCLYDHTETDINSWHFYIDNVERARDHVAEVVEKTFPGSTFNYADGWKQDTAPLINSEYGGVGAGSGDRDISWVFLFLTNLLRKYDKIGGYVYTELEDIEWEHNGFMNYDRSPKVYDYPAGITLADLQGKDFPVLDCPPHQEARPGDTISIPVLLSHWSEDENLVLRYSVAGATVDGRSWTEWVQSEEHPADAKPFTTAPQPLYTFTAPDARGLLNVVVEVLSGGKRVGANYCVINVVDGAAWNLPQQFAAAFAVRDAAEFTFSGDLFALPENLDKVYGLGAGKIVYRLKMPAGFAADVISSARLLVEVGAKAGDERLDWPARKKAGDYPQTDGNAWPSDVVVSLNDVPFHRTTIADDFADAAGVLSHVAGKHHGSHGVMIDAAVEGDALAALKQAVANNAPVTLAFEVPGDAANRGGLALYGANMGAWPADPTLLFTLAEGARKPEGAVEAVDSLESKMVTLIPTGPRGHVWRYTTGQPGADWAKTEFDTAGWTIGRGGFGSEGTPGARISTKWETSDIWLRTSVEMPAELKDARFYLAVHHDEDVQVYINGREVFAEKGYLSDYKEFPIDDAARGAIRFGEDNTVAVHCRQTSGGQYVDLGLRAVQP